MKSGLMLLLFQIIFTSLVRAEEPNPYDLFSRAEQIRGSAIRDCAREANNAQATVGLCVERPTLADGSVDCERCDRYENEQRFVRDLAGIAGIDMTASVLGDRMRVVALASLARDVCENHAFVPENISEYIPPECSEHRQGLLSTMTAQHCGYRNINQAEARQLLSRFETYQEQMREDQELVTQAERFCHVSKLGQSVASVQQNGGTYNSLEHQTIRTSNHPTVCCCRGGDDLNACYDTGRCQTEVSSNRFSYLYKNSGCTTQINYGNTLSGIHLGKDTEDVTMNVAGTTLDLVRRIINRLDESGQMTTHCQFDALTGNEVCERWSIAEDIERNSTFYLSSCQQYIDRLKNKMIESTSRMRDHLAENQQLASLALRGHQSLGRDEEGEQRRHLSRLPSDVADQGENALQRRKQKLDSYTQSSFDQAMAIKPAVIDERLTEQFKLFCSRNPRNGGISNFNLMSITPLMDITIAHFPNSNERDLYATFSGCFKRKAKEAGDSEFWESVGFGVSCAAISVAYPPAGHFCLARDAATLYQQWNRSEYQDNLYSTINGASVPGADTVGPGNVSTIDIVFTVADIAGTLGTPFLRTTRARSAASTTIPTPQASHVDEPLEAITPTSSSPNPSTVESNTPIVPQSPPVVGPRQFAPEVERPPRPVLTHRSISLAIEDTDEMLQNMRNGLDDVMESVGNRTVHTGTDIENFDRAIIDGLDVDSRISAQLSGDNIANSTGSTASIFEVNVNIMDEEETLIMKVMKPGSGADASGCHAGVRESVNMRRLHSFGLGPRIYGVMRLANGQCAMLMDHAGISPDYDTPSTGDHLFTDPEVTGMLNDDVVRDLQRRVELMEREGWGLNGDWEWTIKDGKVNIIDSILLKKSENDYALTWSNNSYGDSISQRICSECPNCTSAVCP